MRETSESRSSWQEAGAVGSIQLKLCALSVFARNIRQQERLAVGSLNPDNVQVTRYKLQSTRYSGPSETTETLREIMEKHWHALYVNSRAEKKISENLQSKNIEAYVPLVKTMKQWSDRKKMVELPLMNGYVFVKISQQENDKVMQTRGVVNFVRSEGKIATIREMEIERLKQLVELGYQLEASAINKTYKEGDKVKITSGALKGIEGYVVESKEDRQIEVLLESIGQCIRVRLPKEVLLAI